MQCRKKTFNGFSQILEEKIRVILRAPFIFSPVNAVFNRTQAVPFNISQYTAAFI